MRLLLAIFLALPAIAQISPVTTYHNDPARTGWYPAETTLTLRNVNQTSFGKLGAFPVDGQVYGQPLYFPGLAIPNVGTRNVVFVVTEHDSIYAFDADVKPGVTPAVFWHLSFINPDRGTTTVPFTDLGTDDIHPEIGITSTPVIDPATKTIYVTGKIKYTGTASPQPLFRHLLGAFDLATGRPKFGSPVIVHGYFPGSCLYNDGNGHVQFSPRPHLQRAGLALANGTVYVAFASHGDVGNYNGWMFGYNATDLTRTPFTWNVAPNAIDGNLQCRGGIWSSGGAPAIDSTGNLYVATGNGSFNADSGGNDYGDSIVKLNTALVVQDFFTPWDQLGIMNLDVDIASGGTLILPDQLGPHPHLVIGIGKGGVIYLLNRDALGGYNTTPNNPQIIQNIAGQTNGVFGNPAYYNGTVYFGGYLSAIKAFPIISGLLTPVPTQNTVNVFGFPGVTPSISSNGISNAILWGIDSSGFSSGAPAVLHAFDANNLSNELYNSTQAGSRDTAGPAVKFTVPTIANGRVYVGTSNTVEVYGLLGQ